MLLGAFFQIHLIGFAQKHCVHYLYLIFFFNNTKQYDVAKQFGAACDVDCVSICSSWIHRSDLWSISMSCVVYRYFDIVSLSFVKYV